MEIIVNLTDEEYQTILEKAKDDIRTELTEEAVKKFLKSYEFLGIQDVLRHYGVHDRYHKLMKDIEEGKRHGQKFKQLDSHDQLLISIYNLLYMKI